MESIPSAGQPLAETFFSKCLSNSCCKSIYPLFDRVTSQWKEILMDCSTIIMISAFVIALVIGSPLTAAGFFIGAVASGVGAFYMRHFAALNDLTTTAHGLKETKEKLEGITQELRKENTRLSQTNRALERNNALFQQNNHNLTQTNLRLTLQVTALRESAERIRSEVGQFRQENVQLSTHVQGFQESLHILDQQILSSRALCEQIGNHLGNREQTLREQMEQLSRYLFELRADNGLHEKIQQLGALQQQTREEVERLHQIQLQYATERSKFQTIREALVQLKEQFDQAIQSATHDLRSNNQQFSQNVTALSQERERIQALINRHLVH